MERDRIQQPQGGDRRSRHRRSEGIQLTERSGYIHLTGRVRANGQSQRVRETTGLKADNRLNWIEAAQIRSDREGEIRKSLIHGAGRVLTWPQAALNYLEARAAERKAKGQSDLIEHDPEYNHLMSFTDWLEGKGRALELLDKIDTRAINSFLKVRHLDHGHQASTIKRTWAPIRAVLSRAQQKLEWKGTIPAPDIPKAKPKGAAAVIGKWLLPDEIELLIECAADHLKPLIAIQWNTGRRIGEFIWCSKSSPDYRDPNGTGLNMGKGREHIYLGCTKNGEPRIVYLNDMAIDYLTTWLETREDSFEALFLTQAGKPYKRPKKKRGGILKTGYKAAARRAAEVMEKEAEEIEQKGHKQLAEDLRDRANVMRQVSPHWARHNMTSHRLAAGETREETKEQMGWSDVGLVKRYEGDLTGLGKAKANLVQFGGEGGSLAAKAKTSSQPKKSDNGHTLDTRKRRGLKSQ